MPVNAILIVLGLAFCALTFALVIRRRLRQEHSDLGVMNDQWLSEQRLSHIPDHNR